MSLKRKELHNELFFSFDVKADLILIQLLAVKFDSLEGVVAEMSEGRHDKLDISHAGEFGLKASGNQIAQRPNGIRQRFVVVLVDVGIIQFAKKIENIFLPDINQKNTQSVVPAHIFCRSIIVNHPDKSRHVKLLHPENPHALVELGNLLLF